MLQEDAQSFLQKHSQLELLFLSQLFVPNVVWAGDRDRPVPDLSLDLETFLTLIVQNPPNTPVSVGRVGMKVEPAGKVRLFMIMDSISQRLLHSLHKWVYGLLRRLPSDGTYNQLGPLERLKGTVDTLFSFDLKSATDRVPAEECVALIMDLFGANVALAWRVLLYRPFLVPRSMNVTPKVSEVLYTTGTPLGSLSAWGWFALFHHLLVQQAAAYTRNRGTWFSQYAILGDDLVIGCPYVARQYRRLLTKIGVKISEQKSIASRNGSMEYASRFVYRGRDCSPISFRLLAAAREALGAMPSFFIRVEEFRTTSFAELLRLRGAGYRILPLASLPYSRVCRFPKRWMRLYLAYHHPHGRHPLPWQWWLSAGRRKLVPPEALGVLHYQLLENWFSQPEWVMEDQDKQWCPMWEQAVRAPWLMMHLHNLRDTCLSLIQGELIDPLLKHRKTKLTLDRQPSQEGSSLALHKWSTAFRLYDRMTRILSQPLPKLLTA